MYMYIYIYIYTRYNIIVSTSSLFTSLFTFSIGRRAQCAALHLLNSDRIYKTVNIVVKVQKRRQFIVWTVANSKKLTFDRITTSPLERTACRVLAFYFNIYFISFYLVNFKVKISIKFK